MKLKNILITGGAGYVGAVLVPKLLKNGYRVKVIDWYIYGDNVFGKYANHHNLQKIKGDIRDKNLLNTELKNVDAVIHLACISNDPSFELNPELGKSINYDATLQLVDLAKKIGVKRFIYASSSSVYGVKKENEVVETLALEPLTDYSKYKALCERYILDKNSSDFTTLILRPATVCGYSKRLRLDLTVNILTIHALIKKHITVFGGRQLRPNIHIEDMANLYVKTLEFAKKKISGKTYNAGYKNYSIINIASIVKKVLKNPAITIETLPTDDHRSYKVSSQKIQKELGFYPKHTIENAVLDLKNAYINGKIPNALTNNNYYNIRVMKQFKNKLFKNKQ